MARRILTLAGDRLLDPRDRWRYTRWEAIGSGQVVATELYEYSRGTGEMRNHAGRKRWQGTSRAMNETLKRTLKR